MRTITSQELRNDSSAVLLAAAAGQSFAVTVDDRVIAHVVPPPTVDDLPCSRPARADVDFRTMARRRIDRSTSQVLGSLRAER